MKVLLIGSGGREHALAWAISKSDLCETLFCAPGNAGIAELAECVLIDAADHNAVTDFAREQAIDLVVVGPEAPLVAGLVDHLADAGIRAFGPSRAASMLEGSKGFTKDLCERHAIPTASYARFSDLGLARAHVEATGAPIVIKADGLAAGKGVTVAETVDEALEALEACFAVPGAEVVIEEKLEGEEASFFALVDGRTAVPFGGAQDHKRAFDGDQGPNTGGMGAYSPAPILTPEIEARIMAEIVEPTVAAMWEEGAPFTGILFAGIMVTEDGPKLIEYNVRFGDPEAQVLIMRLESDLLGLMQATVEGRLGEAEISWRDEAALAVVMAGRGYPGEPARGGAIGGLEEASAMDGVAIFHAATRAEGDRLVADGGRVLAVAARGADVREARDRAYAAIARIDWEDGFCRSDIGHRALARQGG